MKSAKAIAPHLASRDDSKLLDTWNGLDAIALGVKVTEKGPVAVVTAVSKSVVDHFDVDLANEISLWPDFTGKAGEIIELPVGAAMESHASTSLASAMNQRRHCVKREQLWAAKPRELVSMFSMVS